ncbi:MAG: adenosine deaminase [Acidobacteriia bacterium]|nr:adenosine deaminase [Terriglobia bacterium]
MAPHSLSPHFLALPKAELHLHLEGSIEPSTVSELAARHGETVTEEEARARYSYTDFAGFIEAFKWVTAYLRGPEDFALITRRLAERLRAQNVVYAELTLSVGVMLWRKQSAEANFEAMLRVAEEFSRQGLRLRWIFDVTRQFGAEPALRVAEVTAKYAGEGVVAFGMGGDELSVPAAAFREAYDYAAEHGLHRLVHAGEIGGPGEIRDAIELLGAERIGHGISAMHDPALQELLAERRIPLEICPTSNLCTAALAKQLVRESAAITDHPLPALLRRGLPIVLSSDDPAMFHTSLLGEYAAAGAMGLREEELRRLLAMSFEHAFDGPPPIED